MSLFYLVRHGSTDMIGRALAARTPGVRLNADGRRQAQAAAAFLADQAIERVLSSPLERAVETAGAIAARLSLRCETNVDLNEVDFGEWTGKSFEELEAIQGWKQWNLFRAGARPPGGETMLEVQARMVRCLEALHRESPEGRMALVSHGDSVRAALMFYLGMGMDSVFRIEIGLGSVSILELNAWGATVKGVNVTGCT